MPPRTPTPPTDDEIKQMNAQMRLEGFDQGQLAAAAKDRKGLPRSRSWASNLLSGKTGFADEDQRRNVYSFLGIDALTGSGSGPRGEERGPTRPNGASPHDAVRSSVGDQMDVPAVLAALERVRKAIETYNVDLRSTHEPQADLRGWHQRLVELRKVVLIATTDLLDDQPA